MSIDGAGRYRGFIVGFFNETFAEELRPFWSKRSSTLIPPLFESTWLIGVVGGFQFSSALGDTVVEILFESFLQNMEFFVEGARIGMETTANALAVVPDSNSGKFWRANCLSSRQRSLLRFSPLTFNCLTMTFSIDFFSRFWKGGVSRFHWTHLF